MKCQVTVGHACARVCVRVCGGVGACVCVYVCICVYVCVGSAEKMLNEVL